MTTTPDRTTSERRPDAPERTQQASGHQMPEYDAQSDADERTNAEWERDNLEWATGSLSDAWTAMIRALYRDTKNTPGEYGTALKAIRRAHELVTALAKGRGGMV